MPGANFTNVETSASIENLVSIRDGKMDLGMSVHVPACNALEGKAEFEGSPVDNAAFIGQILSGSRTNRQPRRQQGFFLRQHQGKVTDPGSNRGGPCCPPLLFGSWIAAMNNTHTQDTLLEKYDKESAFRKISAAGAG
ncbi:hypothetical protein MBH78_19485 [Oceanimonas sp. NS1]|nr:hypothetical protein [Oceanimonas sp. NS1]